MKLKISENNYVEEPSIVIAPPDDDVLATSMQYFDKDGYELNETEILYHNVNNVDISEEHLFHIANHKTWIYDEDDSQSNFVVDHSMVMQRWDYQKDARAQIYRLIDAKPTLGKLLSTVKKWGLDFSLDYVHPVGMCTEIFHIENDFRRLEDAIEAKKRAEDLILSTNWDNILDQIFERRAEWQSLCSDDQADWKAELVGWHRAFDNQKVFI